VKIKRSLGYSGDLCDDGKQGVRGFLADWDNNGTFDEYLGTAFVTVHDLSKNSSGRVVLRHAAVCFRKSRPTVEELQEIPMSSRYVEFSHGPCLLRQRFFGSELLGQSPGCCCSEFAQVNLLLEPN